jgi:hypothetical protein
MSEVVIGTEQPHGDVSPSPYIEVRIAAHERRHFLSLQNSGRELFRGINRDGKLMVIRRDLAHAIGNTTDSFSVGEHKKKLSDILALGLADQIIRFATEPQTELSDSRFLPLQDDVSVLTGSRLLKHICAMEDEYIGPTIKSTFGLTIEKLNDLYDEDGLVPIAQLGNVSVNALRVGEIRPITLSDPKVEPQITMNLPTGINLLLENTFQTSLLVESSS